MIKNFLSSAVLGLATLLSPLPSSLSAQQFGVAGSPVSTIEERNYVRLFTALRRSGINNYFPTFQYQEVPTPKSLGFERDFTVPCSPDSPAFKALRETGMKLILPGELVYPNAGRIGRGTAASDPLIQIIACAGRTHIAAITNYDEAAYHGIALRNVEKLYGQVKKIDPTLPVLMVHGPIITDKEQFSNKRRITKYLQDVVSYSAHADVVGFDVYPIPDFLARVATPLSDGEDVRAERAVAEYMSWLNSAVPNKPKLMVLQGFAYSDLYEKAYRKANVPLALLDQITAPDLAEMDMMVSQARQAGVEYIVWWGVAALPTKDAAPWPTILEMGRRYGR